MFVVKNQQVTNFQSDDSQRKRYGYFCTIDEFDKNLSLEMSKNLRLPSRDGNQCCPK